MEESSVKVLHAGGYITGVALAWFKPIIRDYLNKEKDDRKEETNTIFKSYNKFEKAIKKAFGTVDEARATKYYINGLKQKGSASDYAARFRQLASQLNWEDEPLMSAFYKGLKEEVKDKLYKENKPNNLSDYIAIAKIEVTESEVEHKNLNWTFCYNDNCYVHMSSKQERGWFPKEPRKPKKKIINFMGNRLQVAQQLVQEDLDEQSMEKRTLAITGRKELHEPKSPEYLDEDSHQEILDWVRQQAEARKIRREQ
ncbi:uncharacterized protein G6M90_00g111990 [Metarhizium brunneum]|uniref:Retrotransposon gag domain-containing protein n=1 Tax=Metarhizium brunneum TaxID=500148 RepID=A0A7D5V6L1_9HYPO